MRIFILSSLLLAAISISSFMPAANLKITSTAFDNNTMIPEKYSCHGAEVNPPLHIDKIPSGTQTLALFLHDPDAPMPGGFTHWVLWNIGIDGNIPEDFKGAAQGFNGQHTTGYKGMCPPSGIHHYHFMVYALDTKLNLPNTAGKAELEQAIRGHILAQGELTGLYENAKQ